MENFRFPPPMCDPVTMWVLLATGFTGALTLVFLLRCFVRWWSTPSSVELLLAPNPGAAEAVVRELKRARKEIVLLVSAIRSQPILEALVAAKGRGVRVEILFDSANATQPCDDLTFLADQGLAPVLDREHRVGEGKWLLIDRRVLLVGPFDFDPQRQGQGPMGLLLLRGHADVLDAYRQSLLNHKGHSEAVPARIARSPQQPAAKAA